MVIPSVPEPGKKTTICLIGLPLMATCALGPGTLVRIPLVCSRKCQKEIKVVRIQPYIDAGDEQCLSLLPFYWIYHR